MSGDATCRCGVCVPPEALGTYRGLGKVISFKDEVHAVGHLDDLPAHQAQLLVVIQHSVHALDPKGIDGAIKYNPFAIIVLS